MISANHLRLCLKQTIDSGPVLSIAERLHAAESLNLHTLYQEVKSELDVKQFQVIIALMLKRGIIKATGPIVELDRDNLTFLFFKNILVEYMNKNYGELKSCIVAYLLQVHVSGYRQTIADIKRWVKANGKHTVQQTIETAVDELITDRIIILDNDENSPKSDTTAKRIIKLNINRVYSLIRAEFCARFLRDKDPKTVQIISIILKHSALYNKSTYIKNTEKFAVNRLQELCIIEAPELVKQGNFEALISGLGTDFLVVDTEGVAVKLEKLIENMKIEVIENYITDTMGQYHIRVFRGLVLLHLASEKDLEEQLLVKRTDYRQALLDLEKHGVIVRSESKEDRLPYKPNVEEFSLLLVKRLSKIIENLEVLRIDCSGKWGHKEDKEVQEVKLDASINLILKRLLILYIF